MRLSDFQKDQEKDKTEITKQQIAEIKLVFDSRIIPNKNHTLFEFNYKTRTIQKAKFRKPNTDIHWNEALEKYSKIVKKKDFKKVDIFNAKTVTKNEVIKNENCIYITSLNKENCIKILKRDFGITIIN